MLHQLKTDNELVLDKTNMDKMIKEMLRLDSASIKKYQQMNQNYVLEYIIKNCNPGLLSKKVLVLPQNESEMHWSVT
jgi:hypothetical protein